jgi:hypothetical protein
MEYSRLNRKYINESNITKLTTVIRDNYVPILKHMAEEERTISLKSLYQEIVIFHVPGSAQSI